LNFFRQTSVEAAKKVIDTLNAEIRAKNAEIKKLSEECEEFETNMIESDKKRKTLNIELAKWKEKHAGLVAERDRLVAEKAELEKKYSTL
jgi:cell division protein FtsB